MDMIWWKKFVLAYAATLLAGSIQAAVLTPIAVTGWEQDVVLATGDNYWNGTTAQFDGGTPDNHGETVFYEIGRYSSDQSTGLPTGLTQSQTTGDVYFQLQSFTGNNALWEGGILSLTSAASYERIALIGTTGGGVADLTITLSYTTGDDDVFNVGSSGIGQDWFNGNSIAYTANGRASTQSDYYDAINANNPRLYETILAADSTRLLESISISDTGIGNNAIMALSGERTYSVPEPSGMVLMTLSLGLLLVLRRWRFALLD
ncbi:MAG: PEP-CTERM sorting domain-containing protein [Spartobacteria bacterium]|nr:PEP-CTERM sorting domain-containing protein [Spartobacteria bacterium]